MFVRKVDRVLPTFHEMQALVEMLGMSVQPDMEGAVLLDDYPFEVNGLSYRQKVWRLKDRQIYVDTVSGNDALISLEADLRDAVAKEDFETAATLRDKINAYKNQK